MYDDIRQFIAIAKRISAGGFQHPIGLYFGQRFTVIETIWGYVCVRAFKNDFGKRFTIIECITGKTFRIQRCGNDNFCETRVTECIIPNFLYVTVDLKAFQPFTIIEHTIGYLIDGIAEVHRSQRRASGEHVSSRHGFFSERERLQRSAPLEHFFAVSYRSVCGHACQRRASVECRITDVCDRVRDDDRSQRRASRANIISKVRRQRAELQRTQNGVVGEGITPYPSHPVIHSYAFDYGVVETVVLYPGDGSRHVYAVQLDAVKRPGAYPAHR